MFPQKAYGRILYLAKQNVKQQNMAKNSFALANINANVLPANK